MIPRQKTTACATPSPRPPDWRLRKYDIVIGIIGKTQGVKMEARPKPKATSRNAPSPCCWAAGADAAPGGARAVSPRSSRREWSSAPAVSGAVPDQRDGTHCVSLQV